jgi:hypothetical protein
MVKMRSFVRYRKSNGGHFIASVPYKCLVKMAGYDKLRWSFIAVSDKEGWLVLEAF